jgi:hypothetical protein
MSRRAAHEQMTLLVSICSASSDVDNVNVHHSTSDEIDSLEDSGCGGIERMSTDCRK